MSTERILLRVSEAAEMLSISRAEAYQLVAKGVIPSVRIGSMIRIPADALKALAEQGAGYAAHREPLRDGHSDAAKTPLLLH